VVSYRAGTVAVDNHSEVQKLARIEGISRDMALTAAKLEAQILDEYESPEEKSEHNKRRKWDCFHIATAQVMKCSTLYTVDDPMLKRKERSRIKGLEFSYPISKNPDLFQQSLIPEISSEPLQLVERSGGDGKEKAELPAPSLPSNLPDDPKPRQQDSSQKPSQPPQSKPPTG